MKKIMIKKILVGGGGGELEFEETRRTMGKLKLPSNSKLKNHLDFVTLLSRYGKSPKKRKCLLQIASNSEVDACSELFANFLRGNLKISKENFKKLERHQGRIRQIADRKLSRKKKKNLLGTQTGGYLGLLLPSIMSFALAGFKKLLKL